MCGSWPPRSRRPARAGAKAAGPVRATASFAPGGSPGPLRGRSGKAPLEARPRGAEEGFGAERSPETLRSTRPLPLAHSASRAPGSLDLPLLSGQAPRPRLAQCPSWANFLTPSGEPLSLGPSRTGEGKVGGSGRGFLWKLPGVFETEVTGRRGPFGNCQGVFLSQNRRLLLQTLRSAVSPLRSRLPRSAGCDRLGGGGEPGEVRVGAWEGVPGGDRGSRQERLPSSPTDPHPLTFDFCSPGEEGPHQCPRPGAHLIPAHLRAAPAGRGRGELGPAPLGSGLGYCIVPVWARSGVFYLPPTPTPPHLSLCRVLTPCYPRATPRAGLHPPHRMPPENPGVSNRPGTLLDQVVGCLEAGAGRASGLLSAAPPSRCGEKVPGKSQVLGTGGSLRWALERSSRFSVQCTLSWV